MVALFHFAALQRAFRQHLVIHRVLHAASLKHVRSAFMAVFTAAAMLLSSNVASRTPALNRHRKSSAKPYSVLSFAKTVSSNSKTSERQSSPRPRASPMSASAFSSVCDTAATDKKCGKSGVSWQQIAPGAVTACTRDTQWTRPGTPNAAPCLLMWGMTTAIWKKIKSSSHQDLVIIT
jgi:hypothetical protein